MSFTKEQYDKAKELLKTQQYQDAKNIVEEYEKEIEAEKEKNKISLRNFWVKGKNCDHDWETNQNSPPWERTFYCKKCGINEDGWGEQW